MLCVGVGDVLTTTVTVVAVVVGVFVCGIFRVEGGRGLHCECVEAAVNYGYGACYE